MLFEIKNNTKKQTLALLNFAKKNNIALSILSSECSSLHLPGVPLSQNQLKETILASRESGSINMIDAHDIIRNRQ